MEYNLKKFESGLRDLNIVLSDEQFEQFISYYELLIETNKVVNLTAITDFDDVIEKHFLDSISLCRVYDLHRQVKIIDMGTGAGFPGLPLKIAFPEIELVLVDSLNKRVKFLERVIEYLHLKNVQAIHARAEELARNLKYRDSFDLCVSRAVASLSVLSEYCMPFVKEGGNFISYKSSEIEEEVEDAKRAVFLLGGKIMNVHKFNLSNQRRSFVIIQKEKKTPKAYPRKAGTPTKSPLN